MISLILPYWMRQEAADVALASIDRLYAGLDLEVIVVDDGSVIPFVSPCKAVDVRVITVRYIACVIAMSALAAVVAIQQARGR